MVKYKKCIWPGNARGHEVGISGNYAKKCDFRKENGYSCDMTGKKKVQNKENLNPCSCPGSSCSLLVRFAGPYADKCGFWINHGKACDTTGKQKAMSAKRKSTLLEALEAQPSPQLNGVSDEEKRNAVKAGIVALNAAIAKVRKVVGEVRKITHSVFLISCGATSYGGVENAPNIELARTSLTTKARPAKSKSGKYQKTKGRQGSIVIAVGLNYKAVSAEDAHALYSY